MGRLSRIIGGGGGPRVGCNHEGPFKKRAKGGLLQKEDRVRQGNEAMCFESGGRSYKPKETDSPQCLQNYEDKFTLFQDIKSVSCLVTVATAN